VARHLRLVEAEGGVAASQSEHRLGGGRTGEISELGVNVLICGALSRELENGLWAQGITVVAGVCGAVDEVLCAYLAGRLCGRQFVLPGWVRGRGSRWMSDRQCKREEEALK